MPAASKGSILIGKLIFAVCLFGGLAFAILALGFILGRKFPEGNTSASKKRIPATEQKTHAQKAGIFPTYKSTKSAIPQSAESTPATSGEGPFYPVYQEGKWGYADKKGNIMIGASFLKAMHFKNGLAPAQTEKGWGFLNKDKLTAIPYKYEEVRFFSNGLAAVKLEKHWGYIDPTGKVVIPFQFDIAGSFDNDGRAIVGTDGVNGNTFYIDQKGQCVDFCAANRQPLVVKRGRWYGLVGQQDRELTGFVYDSINYVGGRMVPFRRAGKWGVYDLKKMTEILEPMYDYVGRFQEGMAGVKWGNDWGYINYSGGLIEPGLVYEAVGAFSDGKAYVRQKGKEWMLLRGKKGFKKKKVKRR